MNRSWRFMMLAFVLCGTFPTQVAAQTCSATASNLEFGTILGNPTPQTDATASINISCSGTVGQTVRVCVGVPEGEVASSTLSNRLLANFNGTNTLQYQIYKDAGRSQVWGVRNQAQTPLAVDIPIASSGGNAAVATMYGRVFGGQTKPDAVYFANFTAGNYRGFTRYGYVVSPTNPQCDTAIGTVVDRFTFQAGVEVAGSCTVSATNISFGTVLNLATEVNATGTLSATCTLNLPFTIALNGGINSGDINNRQMKKSVMIGDPLPPRISYQLYKNVSRTLIWGDTVGTTVSATGTGAQQVATVYGNVPAQSMPRVGTFTDTITVTVTY